ncbi:MAG: LLM class flavin-dependent oxidoreductase [Proteobacteria bacterium]|nr:LLM class flavin-dependent oxidoreductase [Pseudomonadota bacterium]MDA1299713.1 LLM class flavin-dependent oxidoreductase [Pseudomonadota bacterium]
MKCGIVLPRGDVSQAMEAAARAEASGWDGFFVWDGVWGTDAWISLTAAATATKTIRLGTLLSPLSRMRPWDIAAKYATLDHFNGGRTILSVGLGAVDTGFDSFGEETDVRRRAELMDESLEIITGLWQGQPYEFTGKHYQLTPTDFPHVPPTPIQKTIWVVGLLSNRKSFGRATRYQGLLPSVRSETGESRPLAPNDITTARRQLDALGVDAGFDIIVEGQTDGADVAAAAAEVRRWQECGGTWWIESQWDIQFDVDAHDKLIRRIEQGPPAR